MTYEAKLSNIITRLKEVRANHPELTLQKISDHTGVSLSTVTRIFAEGSEASSFRYDSVRPIAEMLLDLDDLDEGDDDEKALKAIIQFKDSAIKQLQEQLVQEHEKYEKKLEKERAEHKRKTEFLMNQIEKKDARIDWLFDLLKEKK